MSRTRRPVQRLDTSPEMVASWNDTSAAARERLHLQAKTRLQQRARPARTTPTARRPPASVPPPAAGRKRPRKQMAGALSDPPDGLTSLDVRRRGPSAPLGVSLNPGSATCSSSGSGTDSDTGSFASDVPARRESWRRVGGGRPRARADDGGCSGADTDSETGSECPPLAPSLSSARRRSSSSSSVQGGAGYDEGAAAGGTTSPLSRPSYRWPEPPPPFTTCLSDLSEEDMAPGAAAAAVSLLGLCAGDRVDDQTWLTSGFIDVVMAKFARTYRDVHFMPIEFAALFLRGAAGGGGGDRGGAGSSGPRAGGGSGGSGGGGRGASGGSSRGSSARGANRSSGGGGGGGSGGSNVEGAGAGGGDVLRDILGRPIDYHAKRPVIFLANIQNLHWNLLRVEHGPVPELQLFEPMGKPAKRQSSAAAAAAAAAGGAASGAGLGLSFRYIPKEVFHWLDSVWPLDVGGCGSGVAVAHGGAGAGGGGGGGWGGAKVSWKSRAVSAITRQQQTTGFDCGVASLLYAEKCGQGQLREDVDEWTTQEHMTEYRRALRLYLEFLMKEGVAATTPSKAGPGSCDVVVVPDSDDEEEEGEGEEDDEDDDQVLVLSEGPVTPGHSAAG